MTDLTGQFVIEVVVVVCGAVVTALLVAALLYWVDREWQNLDKPLELGQSLDDTSDPPA